MGVLLETGGGSGVAARGEGTTLFFFFPFFLPDDYIQKYYRSMLLSHIINPAFHLLGDVAGAREVVRSLDRPR